MTEAGRHYDDGKPRVDLISPQALTVLGIVLSYGAKKYGDKNWLNGIAWTKLYGSALRHLLAWRRGETLDPESGLPHLAHAMCNVMMLLHYAETGKDKWDDRAPEPPKFRPEDWRPGPVGDPELIADLQARAERGDFPPFAPAPIVINKGQAGVQR